MPVTPLQALPLAVDGTNATAAGYGTPIYNFVSACLGTAAGGPDTNNGNPVISRLPGCGFLSFTNAGDLTQFPGIHPMSVYDTIGAHTITVPIGQQLLVTQITSSFAGSNAITVTDDLGTSYAVGNTITGTTYWSFPLILDQNWSLTVAVNVAALGFYVARDPLVIPVARALTTTATYTVPTGKTFWLMGANAPVSNPVQLLVGGTVLYSILGSAIAALAYHLPLTIFCAQPFAAATVLVGSHASFPFSIWGVLL